MTVYFIGRMWFRYNLLTILDSVPATQIAIDKGAHQAANTDVFGALMEAGSLGLPREAYGNAFKVTFAKKPKLIPLNLEILEAGAQAVRVLEMVSKKKQ